MERDLTKTAAYDYNLPKELIAQDPAEPRDSSRLMVVHKKDGATEDRIFRDITEYLNPGDLLVLNDTRVLPARVEGVKKSGEHGAHVEIFFLNPGGAPNEWTALVRPGRKLPEGTKVALDADTEVTVGARLEDGLRTLIFAKDADPLAIIHKFGKTPLPHYITDTHAEPERYQTVYAKAEKENSVAAPTAGLHFTPELLQKLEEKGVPHVFVTLRVGLGTFRPVKAENIADHIMHEEFCEIPPETAEAINAAKEHGGRVVAVGTTVVRTLESFAQRYGKIVPGALDTRLFISPGFEFRVIDALITNFHLPMSTLLMLVSAFGGYDTMMNAYNEAVRKRYRFFSFGDSMFIE
ncbi:tRNA preQ1(34) S-adenosylmethionine ribosyltransferase-isomerase QueA [uncultured Cloacibacillus sp.]|uniref:tRNA preQ1(34) S-adenosylmethionine ribosyltransferase-isomerase QueA n=1 Tax=uncultured Cloacibacillus sp. TaxID=889794 RepID=UPI0026DA99B6|nr:tRNA preQ1(34) S-adenosylmethionine ribosyltransferase-isomerase QueA [uncultured Cloacibacillus sp.]